MWAHYASNHTGFCVSYDMKHNTALSSCTFPVQYTNQRLDTTSLKNSYANMVINQIKRQSKLGYKEITVDDLSTVYIPLLLFNIKHSSWSYEQEFRCTTGSTALGMPYLEAVPKEIFIGINCPIEEAKEIERIANIIQIPVHRMGFDECSPTFELTIVD